MKSASITDRTRRGAGGWLVVALALAALTALGGCSSSTKTSGQPGGSSSPSASGPGGSPASPSQTASVTVQAYYVRSDPTRLWLEPELHRVPVVNGATAKAAYTQVVAGNPDDPSLRTLAPSGTRVLGVSMHAPTLTVDLSAEAQSTRLGSGAEAAFAQQLALTATQFAGMTQVSLRIEGKPITELWGHVDWSVPIKADQFVRTPVEFTSPTYGATIPAGRLTAKGTAQVFEGVVSLELRNAAGTVVESKTAMTRGDIRAPWSFTFTTVLTAGDWTVVGWEVSAKDGSRLGEHKVLIHVS